MTTPSGSAPRTPDATAGPSSLTPAPSVSPGSHSTSCRATEFSSAEALGQLEGEWPTHVFAQGGCGGLAAAIRAQLADERRGRRHPVFVVVEPTRAACLYLSARAARPTPVSGPLDTALAGLAVGEVSLPAWRILDRGTDFFQAIEDSSAFEAMRVLGRPNPGDPPIVSGETGAAGLGGVLAAIRLGERSTSVSAPAAGCW